MASKSVLPCSLMLTVNKKNNKGLKKPLLRLVRVNPSDSAQKHRLHNALTPRFISPDIHQCCPVQNVHHYKRQMSTLRQNASETSVQLASRIEYLSLTV